MTEAAASQSAYLCRALFVVVLIFCRPETPRQLFDDFWSTWTDDFEYSFRKKNICVTTDQVKTLLLLDLEQRLNRHHTSLADFWLPIPSATDRAEAKMLQGKVQGPDLPAVLQEELAFEFEETQERSQMRQAMLTASQQTGLWSCDVCSHKWYEGRKYSR